MPLGHLVSFQDLDDRQLYSFVESTSSLDKRRDASTSPTSRRIRSAGAQIGSRKFALGRACSYLVYARSLPVGQPARLPSTLILASRTDLPNCAACQAPGRIEGPTAERHAVSRDLPQLLFRSPIPIRPTISPNILPSRAIRSRSFSGESLVIT